MIINLAGKNAIVTGGSRGLGTGIVRSLASVGAKVAINLNQALDRTEQRPHLISPVRSCRLMVEHT